MEPRYSVVKVGGFPLGKPQLHRNPFLYMGACVVRMTRRAGGHAGCVLAYDTSSLVVSIGPKRYAGISLRPWKPST